VLAGGFTVYGVDTATGQLIWTKGSEDEQWDRLAGRSYRLTTDGNRIYLDSRRPNGVVAIAPATGHLAWAHQDDGIIASWRFIKPYQGRLFTEFGILDAATGSLKRRFRGRSGFRITADASEDVLVETFSDGAVVARDMGALDRELWVNREQGFRVARVLITGSEVLVLRYPVEARLSFLAKKGVLESLDLRSGHSIRRMAIAADRGLYPGMYSVEGSRLYLTGTTCGGRLCLEALDLRSGVRLWAHEMQPDTIGPAVPAGPLVFAWDGLDDVVALDSLTGVERWRRNVAGK